MSAAATVPGPREGRRALSVLLGATLTLLAAGGLATPAAAARPSRPSRPAMAPADTVLVRIGDDAITRAQVRQRLEDVPEPYRATYQTPEGRQQFLDRMIEERVWSLTARRKGVADRPEIRRQLDQQQRDLLIRTYVNELMAGNAPPSDSEARAYYDTHRADYKQPATATVSHVQLKTETDARRVRQWAKSGQDWRKLAERFSVDSLTRKTGGALGMVTRDGVFGGLGAQPALAESAFALGAGAIGGPYKTSRGWHVLKVESVRPETTRAFEQVRGVIVRQLGSRRSQEYYRERLQEAKDELRVRPDSTAIRSFLNSRRSAREMFKDAQDAGAPMARISSYEKLLKEYPESDVSAQSQFMIGFIYSEELRKYDEAAAAFQRLLARYPKSELVDSARWMIDHMRSEEAPPFVSPGTDSTRRVVPESLVRPAAGGGTRPPRAP